MPLLDRAEPEDENGKSEGEHQVSISLCLTVLSALKSTGMISAVAVKPPGGGAQLVLGLST